MNRLAKLIPDARGIVDIYRQGVYAGGMIPRVKGDLIIEELYGERPGKPRGEKYESVCILITGGFDD